MKKQSIYDLPYPMFRVTPQEYKHLQAVLYKLDKRCKSIEGVEFLCNLVALTREANAGVCQSLQSKIRKAIYPQQGLITHCLRADSGRKDFIFEAIIECRSCCQQYILERYARHIWVRKLLNYNRQHVKARTREACHVKSRR